MRVTPKSDHHATPEYAEGYRDGFDRASPRQPDCPAYMAGHAAAAELVMALSDAGFVETERQADGETYSVKL